MRKSKAFGEIRSLQFFLASRAEKNKRAFKDRSLQ